MVKKRLQLLEDILQYLNRCKLGFFFYFTSIFFTIIWLISQVSTLNLDIVMFCKPKFGKKMNEMNSGM